MSRYLIPILLLSLSACDDADHEPVVESSVAVESKLRLALPPEAIEAESESDELTFREYGPPWGWMLPATQPDLKIFNGLINACPLPMILPSITGYRLDATSDRWHVIGVGFSLTGDTKLRDCLVAYMAKHNSVAIYK